MEVELSEQLYVLLNGWLEHRPILYPKSVLLPFGEGFVPTHLDCYGTARKVHEQFGWAVIAGIQFLDLAGKLFPWPHMVNLNGEGFPWGLIDASPEPDQSKLGFVPIRLDETKFWNDITSAYMAAEVGNANGPSWGCPLADGLSARWYQVLLARSNFLRTPMPTLEIPPSMPKAI